MYVSAWCLSSHCPHFTVTIRKQRVYSFYCSNPLFYNSFLSSVLLATSEFPPEVPQSSYYHISGYHGGAQVVLGVLQQKMYCELSTVCHRERHSEFKIALSTQALTEAPTCYETKEIKTGGGVLSAFPDWGLNTLGIQRKPSKCHNLCHAATRRVKLSRQYQWAEVKKRRKMLKCRCWQSPTRDSSLVDFSCPELPLPTCLSVRECAGPVAKTSLQDAPALLNRSALHQTRQSGSLWGEPIVLKAAELVEHYPVVKKTWAVQLCRNVYFSLFVWKVMRGSERETLNEKEQIHNVRNLFGGCVSI